MLATCMRRHVGASTACRRWRGRRCASECRAPCSAVADELQLACPWCRRCRQPARCGRCARRSGMAKTRAASSGLGAMLSTIDCRRLGRPASFQRFGKFADRLGRRRFRGGAARRAASPRSTRKTLRPSRFDARAGRELVRRRSSSSSCRPTPSRRCCSSRSAASARGLHDAVDAAVDHDRDVSATAVATPMFCSTSRTAMSPSSREPYSMPRPARRSSAPALRSARP